MQSNAAVEWRLPESGAAATASATRSTPRRSRRLSMPAFAVAVLIELALLFGAIYSVRTHLGHAHHETLDATMPR